ncbi:MAG: hypothetical protein KDA66_10500 [Planctomycetaceae bacterium]|nr:hypothetical protein [Planctomycetaceae bacterium]
MDQSTDYQPRHWKSGLIGMVVVGGLATAIALSIGFSADLREKNIARQLQDVPTDDFRAQAAVVAIRYESLPRLWVRYALRPTLLGLLGGLLFSHLFLHRDNMSSRTSGAILLALAIVFVASYWLPDSRGLTYVDGRDQFQWAEDLRADQPTTRTAAVHAAVELLKCPPFFGRASLIHSLGVLGDEAQPAIPVLNSLKHDPEQDVRDAAEMALEQITESWELQVDAVRGGVSRRIEISFHDVDDQQLLALKEDCTALEVLQLERTNITTPTLAEVVPGIPALKRLKLGGPVDAAAFESIAHLEHLEVLNLPQAECPTASLQQLAKLPHLNLLRIASRNIDDASLECLKEFPSLKYLHLIDTSISDEGLAVIAKLPNLQSFYVDGGHCTERGLATLLEENPLLHIHWNDLHLDNDMSGHTHE